MLVTELLHASLHTPRSLEPARKFYAEVLGLLELERPPLAVPGYWFSVNNAALHLNGREAPPIVGSTYAGSHPRHLCFGTSDLAALRVLLQEAGILITEAGSLGVPQLWITDPAGNVIEFQESTREIGGFELEVTRSKLR